VQSKYIQKMAHLGVLQLVLLPLGLKSSFQFNLDP
jgi:hypothetical protein